VLTVAFDHADGLQPHLVGGKALGLGRMTQAGIPVAPGFTLSTRAYRSYLEASGVGSAVGRVVDSVDRQSFAALEEAQQQIATIFAGAGLPAALSSALRDGYDVLCERTGVLDLSVAVRSSATAEDSAGASFAGEYETFVGVAGADAVADCVRRCWSSAFTARALTYAWEHGLSPLDVDMAVVVQKTVKARSAGVMFTLSPVTGDRSRVVIEASWGLGLSVVGGEVTPDRFVVDKIGLAVVERVLGDKQIEYLDGHRASPVDAERRGMLCLDDAEVVELARIGKSLERTHGAPQDIEFAVDRELPAGRNIVLLQCRPETVWSSADRGTSAQDTPGLMSRITSSILALSKRGTSDEPPGAKRDGGGRGN
jgi:pyruvate, water dikinase